MDNVQLAMLISPQRFAVSTTIAQPATLLQLLSAIASAIVALLGLYKLGVQSVRAGAKSVSDMKRRISSSSFSSMGQPFSGSSTDIRMHLMGGHRYIARFSLLCNC